MKLPAVFAAALLVLPASAPAQPSRGYAATPVAAPATDSFIARGILWKCGDRGCVAAKPAGSPLAMCQLVRRQLGDLAAFSANGTAFAPAQLEKCNARPD